MNFLEILFFLCLGSVMASTALGKVLLIGRNTTFSFDDIEASFAPSVKDSKKCGTLYMAEPLNACLPLTNKLPDHVENSTKLPFVLIIRGGCRFEDKVRSAQTAGFKAAIIYDNVFSDLVAMSGISAGINIPAVFVSKASGKVLAKYAGDADMDLWIVPSFQSSEWSIMAMSFISLLAMSAMLATCFFVRRHHIRRERPRPRRVREFHGMSSRLVKAMPSLIFTVVVEDDCTSASCAICLEDYSIGDKLRILPCCHRFHSSCVDDWLTSWRTFCPICKRDARTRMGESPASETTPLLLSNASLSSVRSSLASSSPSCSASQPQLISGSPLRSSFHHLSTSQSSVEFRSASSQRSHSSYLVSTRSSGYPSFTPFASAHSLPECQV